MIYHYSSRLSVDLYPCRPGFKEARWVVLEDINVEHLRDVFTSTNPVGGDVWRACYHFMEHICWHKSRQTILRSKIEALTDDHPSEPKCLSHLSRLPGQVGNFAEQKQLLARTLELERRRGDDFKSACTLRRLSDVNQSLKLFEEGIQRAKEAL
jgi:hypothetical protein